MLLESGRRRVEVHGKALPGPKSWGGRTKNEGQRGGKTRRKKKKKQWRAGVPRNPRQSAKREG